MHSIAGWFILMWTPRVIILSMCAHCTRKPAERDINPRSRYFRCFGQKVSCYPRPPYTRIPMPLYNYRVFDQASAWPSFRVPRKETYDSFLVVPSRSILSSKRSFFMWNPFLIKKKSLFLRCPLIKNKSCRIWKWRFKVKCYLFGLVQLNKGAKIIFSFCFVLLILYNM